jgi:hypothetical protein
VHNIGLTAGHVPKLIGAVLYSAAKPYLEQWIASPGEPVAQAAESVKTNERPGGD